MLSVVLAPYMMDQISSHNQSFLIYSMMFDLFCMHTRMDMHASKTTCWYTLIYPSGPLQACYTLVIVNRWKVDKPVHEGAVPAYLLDRDITTCAKVLSNTIKQKRKEKAGKWEVPLPKVRPVAEDEMFKVARSGKHKRILVMGSPSLHQPPLKK
ncbi:uncharacterized protein LOC103703145 isoform X4 [Phoenix dactylifera]|uniref:Uncharacterized protein LOC103703145 isoform X4 n=1 Tax=Phoenix dactylifera TaxID=42345 RepID=A0A8B9ARN8_PHODC|nr:uncharacterized protein LOC103703145 isoform X4 [Phoenix dactylifera]